MRMGRGFRSVVCLSVVCLSMVCFSMIRPSRRWNPDFQPGTVPRGRFYREFSGKQAHPFANYRRSFAGGFEFQMRQPSVKSKSLSIVFDRELQTTRALCKPHQHMVGSTVLAHVYQALLDNARQFAAALWGQFNPLQFADKFRCNSGFAPEPFYSVRNKAKEPVGIDLERLHR